MDFDSDSMEFDLFSDITQYAPAEDFGGEVYIFFFVGYVYKGFSLRGEKSVPYRIIHSDPRSFLLNILFGLEALN